jgi:iron complex transport system substrate-binding protein
MVAVSTGLALGAIGVSRRSAAAQDATPSAAGEWTYVDDYGVTITRPSRPERIVAYTTIAASLWDFGLRPVAFYGTSRRQDGSPEVYVGNIDLDAVESLGEEYGQIDLEALVSVKPDLIVNDMWSDPPDIWGMDTDAIAQMNQIAPIAEIEFVDRPITDTIESVEKLAGALGADLEAPQVLEAKERFAKASQDLEAAIAEKPGLTAIFVSATPEGSYWVGNPSIFADLMYFKELGLDIVQPKNPDGYWEELSWEQADLYKADLILIDARKWSSTGAQLKAQVPTFAALPAAKLDAFGSWDTEYVPSYAGFAPVLEKLTAVIRDADPDVV